MRIKKIYVFLTIICLFISNEIHAKNVVVSQVRIASVDVVNETAVIEYQLDRVSPPISADQPIWIFVKFRLSTENDYTDWKDTDDLDASTDASDQSGSTRTNTVNANLSGDVGIVTSGGTKSIIWYWGGSGGIENGTGLSSFQAVKIRVFAIEMVHISAGNVTFRQDPGFTDYTLTGISQKINSDYYLMKYPVTIEMYKDFLNCCANRHDPVEPLDTLKDFFDPRIYFQQNRNNSMWFVNDTLIGGLIYTGTIGVDAQWDVASSVSIPQNVRKNIPITLVSWYNCYDFGQWCGLQMIEEEFYYKAASEGGQSIYYWGSNTPPNSGLCNFNNNIGHPSDVTMYEDSVSNTEGGNIYGFMEAVGNIWEWTATSADGYYTAVPVTYNPAKGPIPYDNSVNQVIKVGGGRWSMPQNLIYSARRYAGDIAKRWAPSGFRLGLFP
jgi:formylglycine-generating enzyme required for sulfatase activity